MTKHSYPLELVNRIAPSMDAKTISNWIFLERVYSDFDTPGRGKARSFTRENLIEIAIAERMNASGFTREHSMQAFRRRATYRRGPGYIEADAEAGYTPTSAELFATAPELKLGEAGWWWAICNVADPNEAKDRGYIVACVPFRDDEASEVLSRYCSEVFTLLPISHIVARVDAEIDRWEAEHG